jgi:hypothetical protein
MQWNCVHFLNIYLFIYRTDMFRLFLSHHQSACYIVQRKNNVYTFQDTVVYISVLQFQCTMCWNYTENSKIFYCFTSRDGWLRAHPAVTRCETHNNVKQQNILNILFIILTNNKFKLKNTNVNNYILEIIRIVPQLHHVTSTLMMSKK